MAEQRNQSQSLEEQNELLERMRAEGEEREWERKVSLNRAGAAERQRLEEDRAHRRREELRAFLRAGLQSFPEEFQEDWLQVNEQIKIVRRAEEAFDKETRLRKADLEGKKSALQAVIKRAQERIAKTFEAVLRTREGQSRLAQLPSGRLDNALGYTAAMQIYSDLLESRLFVKASFPSNLPAHVAPVLLVLDSIASAVEAAKPPKKWGPLIYAFLWFDLYILFLAVLVAVIGSVDSDHLQIVGVLLTTVAVIAITIWRNGRIKKIDLDLERLLCAASNLVSLLSGSSAVSSNEKPTLGLSQSEVIESIRCTRANLAQTLLSEYFMDRLSVDTEFPEVTKLQGEIRIEAERFQALESQFYQSKEIRQSIKHRHAVAYQEILRVGREVVEGVRVPSKRVAMVACGRCSEQISTTLKACPYCGFAEYATGIAN